jgi:hypothetical protein
MGLPAVFIPRRAVAAYDPGQRIHPNISPLRVVGIHDPGMTTGPQVNNSWADQEKLVKPDVIGANLDRLACALAEEKKEETAWKAILVAPPRKALSDVVVAIKTNNIAQQHTRSPVMAKVCHVLTDVIGVKAENIHIYDACHGANLAAGTPFVGLPEGVTIENQWGGSNTEAPVPLPWKDGKSTSACVAPLAMSMKNHFGTFSPKPGHQAGRTDYLIAINKSEAVLGPTGNGGKVLFPRQQLCLIDALWASDPGPGGNPPHQPNRLFMGTCGPVLDYQLATKFRRDEMGWSINEGVANRFLSEFGFRADDLPHDGRIIDAMEQTA